GRRLHQEVLQVDAEGRVELTGLPRRGDVEVVAVGLVDVNAEPLQVRRDAGDCGRGLTVAGGELLGGQVAARPPAGHARLQLLEVARPQDDRDVDPGVGRRGPEGQSGRQR